LQDYVGVEVVCLAGYWDAAWVLEAFGWSFVLGVSMCLFIIVVVVIAIVVQDVVVYRRMTSLARGGG
jgi:hypothetical protein